MHSRHFCHFQCLFKRIQKLKKLFSMCSTINTLISKSLINFFHQIDIDVAFLKKNQSTKVRKIKKIKK